MIAPDASHGTEYPFVVLAGDNAKVKLSRRHTRLPDYAQEGHKTLGTRYTTLLKAYGNPLEHFGAVEAGLDKFGMDQLGAIPQFLG